MWNKYKYKYDTLAEIETFFDGYLNDPNFINNKTNSHYLSPNGHFLYVSYLFGCSSVTNTKKYSNNKLLETSLKVAHNNLGYLDFFVEELTKFNYDLTKVQYIKVNYVDRGIPDFEAFGNMLHTMFPNLTRLYIEQNFMPDGTFNDYLYMLDLLQLDKFILNDFQSDTFDNTNYKSILNVIKEGSTYIQIHMDRDLDGDVKEINDDLEIECHFHRVGNTKLLFLNYYDFERLKN
jgi:hypothetical protein